jgi:hypothetical protein
MCSTKAPLTTYPAYIRQALKKLSSDKHSSLFCHFVSGKEKEFYAPATSGLYYKTFRIVIYNCNDSMIVEPVL